MDRCLQSKTARDSFKISMIYPGSFAYGSSECTNFSHSGVDGYGSGSNAISCKKHVVAVE